MTRRESLARAATGRGLVGLLVVVLLGLLFGYLRDGAPTADLGVAAPSSEEIHGEDAVLLACDEGLLSQQADPELAERGAPLGIATSVDVLACPDRFDPDRQGGPLVSIAGEVVGDVLVRRGGAWIQLNDDDYGLELGPLPGHGVQAGLNSGFAVWLPDDSIDAAELVPGRPGLRGDVLRVTGRVYRADPMDGGAFNVRAVRAEVVAEAARAEQPLDRQQAAVAALFVLLAAGMTVLTRVRLRQR